ncbi:unnamed protein product [Urochloa decumbens]|uniref:F-box domain-containing protein n=1 Tax=Urochloa decumbens TaxID=240449 RepID=A0ABC8VX56_9POAL
MDDLIYDILFLILQLIDSPVFVVRAACTCKRWRRVIVDAAFLRRFRSVHASSLVAGDYFNGSKLLPSLMGLGPRLMDRPSFVPAAAAASLSIDARHFSLDFLSTGGGGGAADWIVFDSRGSLLLLYRMEHDGKNSSDGFPDIVVCELSTRRHRRIPPPPYWKKLISCQYRGCYLVDGEADIAGGCIGMSNFKVLCVFQHYIIPQLDLCTGTAIFTVCSAGADLSSSWRNEIPRLTVGSAVDGIDQNVYIEEMHDLGQAGGSWYFYMQGRNLIVLDGGTGEFSHSVLLPTLENWDGAAFDLHVRSNKFCIADGHDGEPRFLSVFDATMKVYARPDSGEWMLEKSILLSEATRSLPGYKDEFFSQPMNILTRGLGYVILSPKTLDKWLISVDLETMQVALAEEDMGTMVYRCEVPWPPVLNSA